jgi:hypothetical protein
MRPRAAPPPKERNEIGGRRWPSRLGSMLTAAGISAPVRLAKKDIILAIGCARIAVLTRLPERAMRINFGRFRVSGRRSHEGPP